MGNKVILEEGESIESALRRLKTKQRYEFKRWTKSRYGYYEKPSSLKRKRRKMAKVWQIKGGLNDGSSTQCSLHLFIGLEELFARGGLNAVGK